MTEIKTNEITFAVYNNEDITENLDLMIRNILVECFPHNTDHYSHTRVWHSQPSWIVAGIAPDGTIASHCAIVERTISAGNPPLHINVAGIQGFSVSRKWRKKNVSDRMMEIAVSEAKHRELDTGLLFCLPVLKKLYGRMGWHAIDNPVFVRDEQGSILPLPEKNIAMIIPLNKNTFPDGGIDIMGQDW
jgi:hypothetical protein